MVRPFVKRKIAAFAALALCASYAHGQTSSNDSTASSSPAPSSDNTLESARRELKELPAAERSRDLHGKSSALSSTALPKLTLPGDVGNTSARPDPNNPPSATWLQDALNQTAAAAAQRRSPSTPTVARDQPAGYKPVEAPNPFGPFMEQWISPRDLELLRAGQENKKNSELAPSATAKPWEFPSTPASVSGQTPDTSLNAPGSDAPLIPIIAVARNPYIEEPDSPASASGGPNALAPQVLSGQSPSDRDRARVPAPLSSMPTATPQGTRPSTPPKPAATPAEPSARPPTAPLVDDRKYFPQLRRF